MINGGPNGRSLDIGRRRHWVKLRCLHPHAPDVNATFVNTLPNSSWLPNAVKDNRTQATSQARWHVGVRSWLMALTVLTLVPFLLFSAYTLLQVHKVGQDAVLAELGQRTQATAHAVQERLASSMGYLNALASSSAALQNNLSALHEHAKRVAEMNTGITGIALVGPDRKMTFFTKAPFGSVLPKPSNTDTSDTVFATGQPAVSGQFKGPFTGKTVMALGVPVFQDGVVAYCLLMILTSDSLNDLLISQKLPPDWVAGLVDQHGVLIARTHLAEQFVGTPVSLTLQAKLKQAQFGVAAGTTKEGVPVQSDLVALNPWGWRLVVSVPVATIHQPLNQSLWTLASVGVVLLALALVAALSVSRLITRWVNDMVASTRALKRGEQVPVMHSHITELDDMARFLNLADQRVRQISAVLTHTEQLQQQTLSLLDSARRDSLTRLPRRGLFLEQVNQLRAPGSTPVGHKLALLFIDLDNFKFVNDEHGHAMGDRMLVQTAGILRSLSRQSDVLGRMGGDEFALCIAAPAELVDSAAASMAARIVGQVASLGSGIGCSIGIAHWRPDMLGVTELVHRADEAMYAAKRLGKNQFVVHGVAMDVTEPA